MFSLLNLTFHSLTAQTHLLHPYSGHTAFAQLNPYILKIHEKKQLVVIYLYIQRSQRLINQKHQLFWLHLKTSKHSTWQKSCKFSTLRDFGQGTHRRRISRCKRSRNRCGFCRKRCRFRQRRGSCRHGRGFCRQGRRFCGQRRRMSRQWRRFCKQPSFAIRSGRRFPMRSTFAIWTWGQPPLWPGRFCRIRLRAWLWRRLRWNQSIRHCKKKSYCSSTISKLH